MEIEAKTRQSPSLDQSEAAHFASLASEWWDERGKFASLHAFNPARLAFIVAELNRHFQSDGGLANLTVLDIGCGGGILAEPLARLGARVSGIDPVAEAIAVARNHAEAQGLSINYREDTAEGVAGRGETFDIVIASEVIEHVNDPRAFLTTLRRLVRPGGLLIVSTLNRTAKSYALAIVAAEKLLGLIPRGTHQWEKFIRPAELEAALRAAGFERQAESGIVYQPLTGEWRLSPTDLSVNYIVSARATIDG
jgi:2-polyprenyl-6-hydroxyphenyl methylase/3-demethylubiquinone-9 3-methyltransferase